MASRLEAIGFNTSDTVVVRICCFGGVGSGVRIGGAIPQRERRIALDRFGAVVAIADCKFLRFRL